MLHDAVVRLRAHLHLFRLHFPAAHYGVSAREHHRIVDAVDAGDADAAAERDAGPPHAPAGTATCPSSRSR